VRPQNAVHLVTEPARITEFHRPAVVAWSRLEEGGEALRIDTPMGRQLHQDGPDELTEPAGPLEEALDRVMGLFETL
jgi:hypothetical protein